MYICMRNVISAAGRFQFSRLKEYSVRKSGALVFPPQPRAFRDDRANDFGALLMPLHPRQPTRHRPPPIAVHDDGNVPGNVLARHFVDQRHGLVPV